MSGSPAKNKSTQAVLPCLAMTPKLVPLGLQLQVPIQSSGGTFSKPNSPDSDVLEAASVSLTNSATLLVACPDSRGVKKQVLLLLGAADGGGLGGWSGPGWSAAKAAALGSPSLGYAVVESEAGPTIRGGGPGGGRG